MNNKTVRTVARFLLAGFLPLAMAFTALPALAQSERTVLLRNVSLIDPDKDGETVSVNILIKDSLLELITEDLIPLKDADVVYDAAGGVVLGQLDLGQPAAFLILVSDPRQNVEILLDTKRYATFAVAKGQVLKNTFVSITEETPEEKKRTESGWLAYAAPPLAVPLSYKNKDKWNRFSGKYVSGVFAAGVVLDRQRWTDQDGASKSQVGDLDEFSNGEIRGMRFGGVGTLNFERPWVWTVFGATHAFDKGFDTDSSNDFSLFDLRLDIPLFKESSFSIGKQKEPISMERLMPMNHLPMQERAAVSDALLPARNTGLVMAGSPLGDRMTLAGGVFNDWLDKDQPSSFSNNASQVVTRATWTPLFSENESTLFHIGGAFRYSNGNEGAGVRTGPEFNNAPLYIESDQLMDVDGISTYQAEASLRSGPFWLHSEYTRSALDAPGFDDPSLNGYHVSASWILTGEVRPYNRKVGIFKGIPIARDVSQNGWGAWEVASRFSHVDFSEMPNALSGNAGKMDIWSAGVNWYLTPTLGVGVMYRHITLDRFGVEGTSQGINGRVLIFLE